MYTPLINQNSSTFDADIIQSFRDAGHCLITNPFPHHVTIMNHLRSQLDKVFESENSIKADEPWQNENLERIFNPNAKPVTDGSDFPEDLRKLCDVVYKASRQLGMKVLRSFDLEFGTNLIECHTPKIGAIEDGASMVLIKYLAKSKDYQRMRDHCDIGTVTILHQFDDREDLEIRPSRDKDDWITIPYVPNSVVVNIGETLQSWVNDEITAVPHRVVNKHNKGRYSMLIFMGVGAGGPMPEHVHKTRNYLRRIEQETQGKGTCLTNDAANDVVKVKEASRQELLLLRHKETVQVKETGSYRSGLPADAPLEDRRAEHEKLYSGVSNENE